MKRLIKKFAIMNPEMFQGTIDQLGDQGRKILKQIEDYKFKLEQAARIVANDQMLTQKIVQKRNDLDTAAGQIYSIVFDIENIDITQMYEQQQMMGGDPSMMGQGFGQGNGQGMPVETMPAPGQAPQPNYDEMGQDAGGGFGGGDFGGGAAPEGGEETPEGGEEGEDKEEGKESGGEETNEETPEEAPEE